jgi:hypothetical protein
MDTSAHSLHFLVEKWLAPSAAMRIRVVRFGRLGSEKRPYVHVEASASSGSRAIFFFPATRARPCMNGYRLAA